MEFAEGRRCPSGNVTASAGRAEGKTRSARDPAALGRQVPAALASESRLAFGEVPSPPPPREQPRSVSGATEVTRPMTTLRATRDRRCDRDSVRRSRTRVSARSGRFGRRVVREEPALRSHTAPRSAPRSPLPSAPYSRGTPVPRKGTPPDRWAFKHLPDTPGDPPAQNRAGNHSLRAFRGCECGG